MATALHTWLSQAQETTRYDSVAAKYGRESCRLQLLRCTEMIAVVVDTPSGMSQTDQNALRFLRSLTEHSPTFFEGQARLLSPPTPDLVPDLPASPLATPMSMSGPQRTSRRPSRTPRSPYALTYPDADSDALFAFDMPPDDPVYLPSLAAPSRRPGNPRSRPYPACRAYTMPTPYPEATKASAGPPPLGYFPPAPEPSPAPDMFSHPRSNSHGGWDESYPSALPTPDNHYPTYAAPPPSSLASAQPYGFHHSQFSPTQQPQQQSSFSHGNPASPVHTEFDMHPGGDEDRARMSALMYGSMRVRAVVAANEADGQAWS
ncbi:hypothetical protein FRC10_008466 [Ceratobasidium sp. 414]|nr:hypothetical protein FRC10_008466 [Ceratobasidium sp. 414]